MLRQLWIVFSKEIMDNLRDRRTWSTGLFWALFGPILLGGILFLLGRTLRENVEQPLNLPVVGAENAPSLVQFLEQRNVSLRPAPDDPEAAVRAGDLNVVLVIPEGYGADFTAGEPATVRLIYDSTRQSAITDISRARNLINAYSEYIGRSRLAARGVSPSVIEALSVENIDVATPQSQALAFLSMLPYFIIFAIFNGAAAVITDATAGERERGSLEPLLINPVPRRVFVVAKLLSATPFAVMNLLITLGGFAAVFNGLPMEDLLGIRVSLNMSTLAQIFLVGLPIVLLAAAVQTVVASFARSTKEAGTYLPFVGLIPALPGVALAFLPVKPELWTMLIPAFGQQILINQFMRGEPVNPANVLISAAMTLLLGAALVWVAIKLYEREQILFSK
jgi:sodium transport system permease protein